MAVCCPAFSQRFIPFGRGGLLFFLGAFALVGCETDTLYDVTPSDPDGPPPVVEEPDARVTINLQVGDRIERTDSIRVQLEGFDPSGTSGVERLGYTLIVHNADGSREAFFDEFEPVNNAPGDTITASFGLVPSWVSAAAVPASFQIEAYGYMLNRAGDCAAAIPEDQETGFGCRLEAVGSDTVRVASAGATRVSVLTVTGRTTPFPGSSFRVGDLVVDHPRGNVFVSNRQTSALHVFRPDQHAWTGTVAVGSEPWGLHLNRTGDTILVANSGGTSVSYVALDGQSAREVVSRRLQTRNTVLYQFQFDEVREDETEDGELIVESFEVFDFSDRPQFVAQDAAGRVLYSTRPTAAAPVGTVRWVENQAGWTEPETRIVARLGFGPVREELDLVKNDSSMVIAHADSVVVYFDGQIEIFDHPPGYPEQVITSGKQSPIMAAMAMAANPQSDAAYFLNVEWNLEAVSFSDTTYVASSANREYVAFGDGGAEANVGKITLWHSGTGTLSSRLRVSDLVNNASERVRALQLNGDGSLGVARGAFGTYFFSNDLRLRGTVPELEPGGGGAALHPGHPNTAAPSASSTETLAFTVSNDRYVRILDTVHYL
ncbi:hypothetical protein BH23GEM11_BH23GEM11_08610 [soil metagenome]